MAAEAKMPLNPENEVPLNADSNGSDDELDDIPRRTKAPSDWRQMMIHVEEYFLSDCMVPESCQSKDAKKSLIRTAKSYCFVDNRLHKKIKHEGSDGGELGEYSQYELCI